MYANGFLEEKRRSPASMVAVVGLHGAALAAVMIFGTYTFTRQKDHNPIVINVPLPQDPPPVPPPPPTRDPQPTQQAERITIPDHVDPPPVGTLTGPITQERPYVPPTTPQGTQLALNTETRTEVPPPVRRAAQVDPNYRDALQPPYPRPMLDAQRNGSVRVRITIGTDGRVSAIEQLSATDDAFWRVTERQARSRWRFRPATLDGRPIVSTMLMTVTFRIPDDG